MLKETEKIFTLVVSIFIIGNISIWEAGLLPPSGYAYDEVG